MIMFTLPFPTLYNLLHFTLIKRYINYYNINHDINCKTFKTKQGKYIKPTNNRKKVIEISDYY